MSKDPTYWGQPAIFWSAWRAIAAVIGTFITVYLFLVTFFGEHVRKPTILVKDVEIKFLKGWEERGLNPQERNIIYPSQIEISWKIKNVRNKYFWSNNAINVHTQIWFDKEVEGYWIYRGEVDHIEKLIPRGKELPQKWQTEREFLADGKYLVYLLITSGDKILGEYEEVPFIN